MTTEDDDGFTLIEAVISIMVISIAVVALVAGLVTMIQLTGNHRGHAVVETAARSFGQAIQATAQSSATLTSSVTAAATQISVTDASTLPRSAADGVTTYLSLEREVVVLTNINRTTNVLTVSRGAGGTTPAAHAVTGTSAPRVFPLFRCPTSAQLTPPPTSYKVATNVTPSITAVEYLDPNTGLFTSTSASGCTTQYQTACPGTDVLPECGTGLFRVALSVSTAGDARLKNVAATSQVLVRTGSS